MKITEVTTRKPKAPLTPAEARIQTYKNQVKNAPDALERERQTQKRQKAYQKIRRAQEML
jgi:hypothetical protein